MPTVTPVTLRGARARLEPLTAAHAAPLLAAASEDRALYALTLVRGDLRAMEQYIATALAEQSRGESLPFATIDLARDRVVGSTRFMAIEHWTWPAGHAPPAPVPRGPDVLEIGATWLAASAVRTAINTEAKLLQLTHAFETWGVRRVMWKTDARNERSRTAIARLGARFDGVLRAQRPAADGVVRDSAYFSMLASEWPAAKEGLLARLARR